MVALWTVPAATLMLWTWCVFDHYRIEVPSRLSAPARQAVVASVRAALEGREAVPPAHSELARSLADNGPVIVGIWHEGSLLARVTGRGVTIADAVADAAGQCATHAKLSQLPAVTRHKARIKVDIVVGRGPLARQTPLATALSVNPGREGLGVTLDGQREVLLLPDDLVRQRLLLGARPVRFVPDFQAGLDFERADTVLAQKAALPAGGYGAAARAYWRFRVDSFVERSVDGRDQAPLALTRGLPSGPPPTAVNLLAGARAGARYAIAHLADNGRYVYHVDLSTGRSSNPKRPGPYSIPRHAGVTYFLSELYRHTQERFLREPIERAFGHLDQLVRLGGCRGVLANGRSFACVTDRGRHTTDLGSTALTVVALAEYRRATQDPRYDGLASELTEWILFMQKDNGEFAHRYEITTHTRDEDTQLLYYSGEAALALARMYVVANDDRYLRAAERALDALVRGYEFFLGGFFYGEEHWTCIAAEAVWPHVKHDRYREFCSGYARFLRLQQPHRGEFGDQDDWAGSYGFTPFIVPHNTPAGSRTEAMLSAYLLTEHHGRPEEAIRRQIVAAMEYVLRQQITEESAWDVAAPADGLGAMPGTVVDRQVRIDYIQHVGSAMTRTAALLARNRK